MSETYLKPRQTSKMKLLAKVVNASRDVFRTVYIQYSKRIQNIWDGAFYKNNEWLKAINFFRKKNYLRYFVGS